MQQVTELKHQHITNENKQRLMFICNKIQKDSNELRQHYREFLKAMNVTGVVNEVK